MLRKYLLIACAVVLLLGLLARDTNAAGLTRVTGSGILIEPDGTIRVATTSARIMPDGSVKGEGQGIVLMDSTVIVHTQMDCMRLFEIEGVPGTGAVLSGWSTFTKNFPPGVPNPAYIVIAVFDSGLPNSEGDVFSRGIPAPSPEVLNCEDPFPWMLIPLEHGSVQISE